MAGGRPTDYTEDLGDIICENIARGISLVKTCDGSDDMPNPRTVYRWLRTNEEFCQNYTRAQEDKADFLADDVLDVADDPDIEPADKRIRVDARKWAASKLRPKKYGDKVQQDITSGGQPINNWVVNPVTTNKE